MRVEALPGWTGWGGNTSVAPKVRRTLWTAAVVATPIFFLGDSAVPILCRRWLANMLLSIVGMAERGLRRMNSISRTRASRQPRKLLGARHHSVLLRF